MLMKTNSYPLAVLLLNAQMKLIAIIDHKSTMIVFTTPFCSTLVLYCNL